MSKIRYDERGKNPDEPRGLTNLTHSNHGNEAVAGCGYSIYRSYLLGIIYCTGQGDCSCPVAELSVTGINSKAPVYTHIYIFFKHQALHRHAVRSVITDLFRGKGPPCEIHPPQSHQPRHQEAPLHHALSLPLPRHERPLLGRATCSIRMPLL